MSKIPIIVEGKSAFWHIQLKFCIENCEPALTVEQARNMDYGQLLVYAGEHQRGAGPKVEQPNMFEDFKAKQQQEILDSIELANDKDSLTKIWNSNPRLHKDEWFTKAMKDRKQFLVDEGLIIINETADETK